MWLFSAQSWPSLGTKAVWIHFASAKSNENYKRIGASGMQERFIELGLFSLGKESTGESNQCEILMGQ